MRSLELVGTSPAIAAIRREVERAAMSEAKVLVTGESGVGKEIVARSLHAGSRRSRRSFVAVNCAGIPDTLLESELFGHARGSFTGAYRDKPGLLQLAHEGTLFLDEVGETTTRMQSLLLRFLETGDIQHVGSTVSSAHVDVRIIAATNRHLSDAVAAGEFRQDFFYRLNVVHLHVPPLRERVDDIPLLLEHFTRIACVRAGLPARSYSAAALSALQQYQWPGNVRELKNVVDRVAVAHEGELVDVVHLPTEIQHGGVAGRAVDLATRARPRVVDAMFERISRQRESFWLVAYAPFMLRDVTRDDIRGLIARGLEEAGGDHERMTRLFNMDQADYRRLLNFLRKHQCQGPVQRAHQMSSLDEGVSEL